ncbi:hypothetical protein [Paenibacillus campi]|uniref:hypothetical protein n=1 Tax=Paenibacillus campi TaxID=3106031 RepID=UPI002AFEF0C2|nr:hypothetical protein [Paenibacillus sp. SGZ-1009]
MMIKKGTVLLITATLTLGIGTGAIAATGLQPIRAYLNSTLSFKVNGTAAQLTDSSGKAVLPITYNGTTYLPVRAVGQLMDIPVNYDSANASISIGNGSTTGGTGGGSSTTTPSSSKQSLSELGSSAMESSALRTKDPAQTVYKGKDYKEVYRNDQPGSYRDFQVMTDNKYSTLHLEMAVLSGNQKITIYDGDRTVLKTVSLSADAGMTGVDVDVKGVKAVFVESTDYDPGSVLFVPLTTSYLVR